MWAVRLCPFRICALRLELCDGSVPNRQLALAQAHKPEVDGGIELLYSVCVVSECLQGGVTCGSTTIHLRLGQSKPQSHQLASTH